MTRPSEAAGARWDEIDEVNKLWTIPAERMKMRRDHAIQLTEQTLSLLDEMKPISGANEFIFSGDRNPSKPTNSGTANMALKRMGFKGRLVAHGLRSLASTTLNEQDFDPDAIEAALAHSIKDAVRAAYNRSDYLQRRRLMMQS
jgi:integrase